MKRSLLLTCCFVFIFFLGNVHAFDIPEPRGFVNDFANVIDDKQERQLEALFTSLEAKTQIEFAIVTLASLENEPIDDLAVRWFETWQIGKQGEDNGLLLLAAIQDRKARIEVGYGLEPIIPDAVAGRVLREVLFPRFREGAYGPGLLEGSLALIERIEAARQVELAEKPQLQRAAPFKRKAGPLTWIFRLLLLLGAVILFIKNPFLFLLLLSGGRGGVGRSFGRGGGFGGFGGGLSGGGGASGSW